MAGDWIKMRTDLVDHPKLFRVAEACGLDAYGAAGRLLKLWGWADTHADPEDGGADVTAAWVDRYVEASGFASALASVGWMTLEPDRVAFANFGRFFGECAKKRALEAEKKKKQREKKREEKRREETAGDMGDMSPGMSPGTMGGTSPTMYQAEWMAAWMGLPPKRRTKQGAFAAEWTAARLRGGDPDAMRDALLAYYASPAALADYAVSPAGFLKRDMHHDDPTAWEADGAQTDWSTTYG